MPCQHSSGAKMRRENASVFSPLPACGERWVWRSVSEAIRVRGPFRNSERVRTSRGISGYSAVLRPAEGPLIPTFSPQAGRRSSARCEMFIAEEKCDHAPTNISRPIDARAMALAIRTGKRYLLAARADADLLELWRGLQQKDVPARPCLPWQRRLREGPTKPTSKIRISASLASCSATSFPNTCVSRPRSSTIWRFGGSRPRPNRYSTIARGRVCAPQAAAALRRAFSLDRRRFVQIK